MAQRLVALPAKWGSRSLLTTASCHRFSAGRQAGTPSPSGTSCSTASLGSPGAWTGTETRAFAEAALRRAETVVQSSAAAQEAAAAGTEDAETIRALAATVGELRTQVEDMQAQLRRLLGESGTS